jgi:ferredoxin
MDRADLKGLKNMDHYETLRERLDAHPSGAPPSKAFDDILRILFSPEEAALAAHMTLMLRPPASIAADAGLSVEKTGSMLEAMADRAIIFSREKDGQRLYGLLPTIPGLFEYPFMRGRGTPELERLGRLWNEYHRDGLGAAFAGNPTPVARVVPVEQALEPATRVHPYEEVARLLNSVDFIALGRCACRVSIDACDKPKEVCLFFDGPGRFLVERRFARAISRTEAHAVLDLCEKAGLVHTSSNSADRPSFICNCCRCCCTILTCRTQLNLSQGFATSGFEARIDAAHCIRCGVCADERCPMGAIEMRKDRAAVDPDKCIGCGLCVTACPMETINLVRRSDPPEVLPTNQEMGIRVLTEKGKLERFLGQMKR